MPEPPQIRFPAELPISAHVDEIQRLLATHQVIVVAGETGSGKSTQLPKIALAAGRRSIAHTQPRRIAARTIAERVAEELGEPIGQTVGYRVRFTDAVGEHTRLTVMTDGILLAAIHKDCMLRAWDTIIIDEAHERSLNIDFLLGIIARILPKRPELRLIITSATIDPESFSRHFGDAPVVTVSGRTFPVEIRYRPLDGSGAAGFDPDGDGDGSPSVDEATLTEGICAAVTELCHEPDGDILVFVSGEADIRDAQAALEGAVASRTLPALDVLPLYGRLSNAEQHRIFEPVSGRRRRVVIATNIAETSVTVPGIRYVVDTGLARISRYSPRSKVQRLPIEPISQASARQRSGRCGRTSDGIAIRLYSEEDFASRPEYTDPEIQRTNLASVILQMASLRLGDIESFPFLTPPDPRGVKDGVDLLRELGALNAHAEITRLGREMSRLPIDPRYARMVLASRDENAVREVLAIVAGLTVQDVRERPLEKRDDADRMHARFADPTSDFLTLLNLWNHLEQRQRELSGSAFRRLCKAEYLNFLRVREWNELYRQLVRIGSGIGARPGEPTVNPDGIHRAILSGLLSHLGIRDDRADSAPTTRERSPRRKRAEYRGARGVRFQIFPGSALVKHPPEAVVAAEIVETSRMFARTVAAVHLEWAEALAGDRAVHSISDPHWERKQGAAVAFERVTLYGLLLVERRRVQLSRFDPVHARELFIRHALVAGEWDSPQAFDRENRKLRKRLEQVEEATRRRDILRDDESVYEFYDARIPEKVVSTRSFEGWWRTERREHPELLTMSEQDLVEGDPARVDRQQFPREWHSGDQRLTVRYRFEPGAVDDGVTITVPLALLPQFSERDFEDTIPGFRMDLITALIKALPKAIRRHVVPAADHARAFLAQVEAQQDAHTPLVDQLAVLISRAAQMPVSTSDFDWSRVPAHLRPSFRVVDSHGRTIEVAKDLAGLQQRHVQQAQREVAQLASRAVRAHPKPEPDAPGDAPDSDAHSAPDATPAIAERDGVQGWDVEQMPREFTVRSGGVRARAHPAYCVARDGSIGVRVFSSRRDQETAQRDAVRALVARSSPSPASYIRDHLSQTERLMLASAPYPSLSALVDDVVLAVAGAVVGRQSPDGLLWSRAEFQKAADEFRGGVIDDSYAVVELVVRAMRAARDVEQELSGLSSPSMFVVSQDVRSQLAGLVFPGFIAATDIHHLGRLSTYLQAAAVRVQRASEDLRRDQQAAAQVAQAVAAYRAASGSIPARPEQPARLTAVRWMLEEFRVSVFAQKLRTDGPVSLTRIDKALAASGD